MSNRIYSPETVYDRWRNYGKRYAVYRSLHDTSVACMFGPLTNTEQTTDNVPGLVDQSRQTAGAVWSVGEGDGPKYTRDSWKGQAFWAGVHDGSNDECLLSGFPTIAEPLTLSAWMYSTSLTSNQTAIGFGGAINGLYHLSPGGAVAGEPLRAGKFSDSGVTGNALSASAYPVNAWFHGIGEFVNDGLRKVYVNGELAGTDTTSITDPTIVHGSIGSLRRASTINYFAGNIAAVFVHLRILSQAEKDVLADNPLRAYEVRVPRYYLFGGTAATHLWPWQIRRMRRTAGSR